MANKEFSQTGARQSSTLPQHSFYILSLSSPLPRSALSQKLISETSSDIWFVKRARVSFLGSERKSSRSCSHSFGRR